MKIKRFQFSSLQRQLVVLVGLVFVFVGGIIITYSGYTARQNAINAAKESAMQNAQKNANQVKAELEVAMDTSRAMADSLAAVKDLKNPVRLYREQVDSMLRAVLQKNPAFLGVSTGWEPNAFDGFDSNFVNKDGHDATGRFIPYLVRDSKGEISLVPLVDYETEGAGEYYLCPKRTGNECILDPYQYEVDGQMILMTSLMAPIMQNDVFYGALGVDIALTSLQKMAEGVNIYNNTGEFVLFSQNGTIAAAGKHPELVGETIDKLHPEDYEEIQSEIQSAVQVTRIDGDNLLVTTPLQIGLTTTPWAAQIIVPMSELTKAAVQQTNITIAIGIFVLLLGLAALWFIIGQIISKPIKTLAQSAELLAQGDVNLTGIDQNKIEMIYQRLDEIGTIGKSFSNIVSYQEGMAGVALKIAKGDLSGQISPMGDKDVLGKAFLNMSESLRKTVRAVAESANFVSNASEELASTSNQAGQATSQIASTIQQVARGTSQQSESVNQTSSSVDMMSRAIEGVARGAQEQATAISKAASITGQISDAIQQVAGNADEVVRESGKAAKSAQEGSQIVQDTLHGMTTIKDKVGVSAQKVQEMGERSGQIGEIITTIEDIASQTNLLALNAAIEAARAGDAGKGFAVVADEVRKLAERSATATKEIGYLIKGIQSTVDEAVIAMQEGSKEVDLGVNKAGLAGEALKSILAAAEEVNKQAEQAADAAKQMSTSADELVNSVDSVSAVVEENSAATEEMAASSNEVTQSIENIASISEENSAAVEEVSAAAEEMSAQVEEVSASAQELSDQARRLQEVVAQFKL